MTTNLSFLRKTAYVTTGLVIGLGLPMAALAATTPPANQVVAQCNDADTEDSFSMSCTPNVIPDTSDQLTEQEVAEPGFNAMPGGFGNESGHESGLGPHEGFGGGGHAGGGGGHGR
jgi:hypothetical protein